MIELIDKFKDCDKVIMIGDWNCLDFSNLDLFTENGFSLANNDSSVPTITSNTRSLDNIIYKGVQIENFKVHNTYLSDHYAISCNILV